MFVASGTSGHGLYADEVNLSILLLTSMQLLQLERHSSLITRSILMPPGKVKSLESFLITIEIF